MLKFLPDWILRYKVHHVPFWLIYHYIWWVVALGNPATAVNTIIGTPQIITFTSYLIFHAAAVYLNLYLLIPHYLEKGRYPIYLALLVSSIVVTSLMMVAGYYIAASLFGISLRELYLNGADCFFFFFGQAFPSIVASVAIVMCIKLGLGVKGDTPPGKKLPKDSADHIYVKSGSRTERVYFHEILYIEGMQNYVTIHTVKRKHVALLSLKSLEESLQAYGFLRIHKSYIVSLDQIDSFTSNEFSVGNRKLPVGRSYRKSVQQNILVKRTFVV